MVVIRIATSLILFLWAGSASAAACPEFFRFVDFGQSGKDGIAYRGGSHFRGQSLEGETLLQLGRTECVDVAETGKDGRGNPIPVVSRIHYDPAHIPVALTALSVAAFDNTTSAAEEGAEPHRRRLERSDTDIERGSNYLCAAEPAEKSFSCQVVSPFLENTALIVYCAGSQCDMPMLVIDNQLAVSATWDWPGAIGDNEHAAADIVDKIEKIHSFLNPLASVSVR